MDDLKKSGDEGQECPICLSMPEYPVLSEWSAQSHILFLKSFDTFWLYLHLAKAHDQTPPPVVICTAANASVRCSTSGVSVAVPYAERSSLRALCSLCHRYLLVVFAIHIMRTVQSSRAPSNLALKSSIISCAHHICCSKREPTISTWTR